MKGNPPAEVRRRAEAAARSKTKAAASARAYPAVFATPDGALVLADLRAQFYDGDMLPTDAHQAAMMLGARQVVRYILDSIEDRQQPD